MSIDLENKFGKYEKELTAFLLEQIDSYQKSPCKKRLENRYYRLKNSIDMNFNNSSDRSINSTKNNFKSKLSFPLVKQRTLIRDAILKQNYRGDPLATVEPTGSTSMEIANNIQDVVNQNLKSTKFKAKAFQFITKDTAEYGASVAYTAWRESTKTAKKTTDGRLGITREVVPITRKNAVNFVLNILDYFQDPSVQDPDDSNFQGHIERTNLSKFEAAYKVAPELYIEENVAPLIQRAHKESIMEKDYHDKNKAYSSVNKKIDKYIIYSTCNIKGNEENENFYYIEIMAGKIIRFQENPHDNDMRPYAIFTFYPRREYWWGNSDAEFVLPHERFTNIIMSMKGDKALQSMMNYLFYEKGSIDSSDWNNRAKNGGLIGVKPKPNQNLSTLIHQVQFTDNALQTTDSIMREVKENQQNLTPRPDLSRSAKAGGLQNSTATAAALIDEQGDTLEAAILEDFTFGLKKLIENNVIMLQQRLGDVFAIRPKVNESEKVLEKRQILGNVDFHIETSLNKNKASELLRLQNMLTAFMNYKGSQDPAMMNIDLTPLVKKVMKHADIGDVDELFPSQPQLEQPGAVESAMMPGQEQAGAVQDLTQPQPQAGALNVA